MIGHSLLMAAALAAAQPAFDPPADRAMPVERCAFAAMSQTLSGAPQWRDLTGAAVADTQLAAEFSGMMPDYRMAFVHGQSLGLLLVGGDRLSNASAPAEDFWAELAAATRRACADSGVACQVDSLSGAAPGMAATTHVADGEELYRRETLAFLGADGCRYAVQFVSPQAALSESGWQAVRQVLLSLRSLVETR